MKKSIVLFLFVLLIANIFVISTIKAETPPVSDIEAGEVNPETGLPANLEKVKGIGENLTDSEIRSQYLKQEWGKILAKNKYIGPVIEGYEKISPYTDPIFKYTIGLEPSLTWLFFLTFVLWIAFVVHALRILELTSLSSKWVQYIISFGAVTIISITGLTRKIAEHIINAVSLLHTWWMQLIGIAIVIIGLIVASIFSKNLQEVFKAMKEKKDKAKEEIRQAKLEQRIRVAEGAAEGLMEK